MMDLTENFVVFLIVFVLIESAEKADADHVRNFIYFDGLRGEITFLVGLVLIN